MQQINAMAERIIGWPLAPWPCPSVFSSISSPCTTKGPRKVPTPHRRPWNFKLNFQAWKVLENPGIQTYESWNFSIPR